MPLFLVTCVCDEGVWESSFRVVEAASRRAVAESILRRPYHWHDFLERSHFWEQVRDHWWSPDEFLKELAGSHVDGDSQYQFAIHEITKIGSVGEPDQMAYENFNLGGVCRAFSLKLNDRDELFGPSVEVAASPLLRSILDENVPLAIDVHTEKARSELIVAPVLLETRRLTGRRIGFFSGIEFDVAPDQGLSGYCDSILSRSPAQIVLTAPVMTIVEAKSDNIKQGLGQCAAEMVAARVFNEREGQGPTTISGAVTTGTTWRFLKLDGDGLYVDRSEYPLEPVGRILSILLRCVGYDPATGDAAT
jgi:hypothetical protein